MRHHAVLRYLCFLTVFLALQGTAALAQTCAEMPFVNGRTADADQLNDYLACLAPIANPTFTGNVGIGTPTPSTILTVAKVGSASSAPTITIAGYKDDLSSGAYLELSKSRGASVGVNVPTASGDAFGVIDFVGVTANGDWNEGARIIGFQDDTDGTTYVPGRLVFYTGTSSAAPVEQMRITSAGRVGIGTASPGYTLHVNGSVAGTSAYNNLSDLRLKKNIVPIAGALGIIEQLQGVRFDWREPGERSIGKTLNLPVGEPQVGFIAQEVAKVLPQAISDAGGKDHLLSTQESKVVPVLVEAVKELAAENKRLLAIQVKQAGELAELQRRIGHTKQRVAAQAPARLLKMSGRR
ncbi:MAG TPA: tail fiber domain-containing protein [Rhizomicrobium sp.]